jgi:S-formylglutathione hydrolase FrmB
MALIHFRYWSEPLGKQMAMHVIVPQTPGPHPVIYQLHGLSDDHSIWLRRTTIEAHAERIGAMVAMLDGDRSFYTDRADGTGAWERHILASVALVDATFRTRADRGGRAIGGLSMGGYGAMKLGLKHPGLFGSVVAHSGVLDIRRWCADLRRDPAASPTAAAETRAIFGARVKPGEDPFALAVRAKPLPQLHIDCGHDDFLIEHNRRFHAHLERRGIAHIYREYPGAHTWDYWQARLEESFDFHRAWFARRPGKARRG